MAAFFLWGREAQRAQAAVVVVGLAVELLVRVLRPEAADASASAALAREPCASTGSAPCAAVVVAVAAEESADEMMLRLGLSPLLVLGEEGELRRRVAWHHIHIGVNIAVRMVALQAHP
eukprot:CAMPEP_0119546248 /NCGR_PEP_ID=MMETSP1352-20130426/753_1 /TAXON_ID=265584 /ORGANISM="Stauroneis constricta, Strain CCMP1120" /LENGTH=118 /DNA_ID=CAMNT_0007590935 /DNA_START=60 /DNA_END=414 /DNA_ORIENTATION=+